jgi:Xaa-Pro dipeptidase
LGVGTLGNKIRELKSRFPQDVANFLILNHTNITYFTGFSGATALLIPQDGESVLYVSGTNFEQARYEVKGVRVELLRRGENLFERVGRDVVVSVGAKLAVDYISVDSWRVLVGVVGGEGCLVVGGGVVRGLRAVKSLEEVEFICEACRVASVGVSVAYEVVGPGVSELEVAAEVEYVMRRQGGGGVAFETIVASGASSAFPHGSCRSRVIMDGDLVVVDLGAVVGGYRSDVTRTMVAGKVGVRQQEMFGVVKAAQDLAVSAVGAGVCAAEVDRVARDIVGRAGFRDCFVHNLGHGVGLEIHESPTLSPDSKDVLEVGNVVTVEPGIYVVGFGGVRIEDTVLVTKDGAKKLTNAAYTLQSG